MDFLNNLGVVIGIITGLISIGGSIVGGIAYLRHKVSSSQQHAIQPQSFQGSFPQTAPKALNKLDWMWVLWNGLEDCFRAKNGMGWFNAGIRGIFRGLFDFHFSLLLCILFFFLFVFTLILFYVYFVWRRIEQNSEEKKQTLTNMSKI